MCACAQTDSVAFAELSALRMHRLASMIPKALGGIVDLYILTASYDQTIRFLRHQKQARAT